jgi:hypothetical protein
MLVFCLLGEKEKKNKKEKEKWPGCFFPRAGLSLLVVPHGIFAAASCNSKVI